MKFHIRSKGIFLLIAILFLLSGCLSNIEKPTGLENNEANQTVASTNENENLEENDGLNIKENNDLVNDNEENENNLENENDNKGSRGDNDQEESSSNLEDDSNTSQDENPKDQGEKQEGSSSKDSKPKEDKEESKPPKKDKPKKDKPKKNQPKEDKPKEGEPEEEEPKEDKNPTITHSIVIAEEGSHGQKLCQEKKYPSCPEDGRAEIPLPPTKMEIENEDTALEALIDITMAKKIHMDYRGGRGSTAYIQGMGNVYEFDRGQGSGWMFRVNGIFPDRGAGVVALCDGDVVEWLYTTNLGQDLNADLKPFRRDGKCP